MPSAAAAACSTDSVKAGSENMDGSKGNDGYAPGGYPGMPFVAIVAVAVAVAVPFLRYVSDCTICCAILYIVCALDAHQKSVCNMGVALTKFLMWGGKDDQYSSSGNAVPWAPFDLGKGG